MDMTCNDCKHNMCTDSENYVKCNKGHIGVQNKCSDFEPLLTIKPEYRKSDLTRFKEITSEMKNIYEIKNKNYGNSFSEQFKEYGLTSVCIRLDDKIRRLKSLNKQMISGNVNVDDESVRDTLVDLANYAILTVIELDKQSSDLVEI